MTWTGQSPKRNGGRSVSENVRVRFAPSPTGYLHIGGARTALFNWLFARKTGGTFILRIEDTDQDRSRDELVKPLLDSMRWLGLNWDEGPEVGGPYGPYFQSERQHLHVEAAERLLAEGKAYRCFCSAEQLAAMRQQARRDGRIFRYPGTCKNLDHAEVSRRIEQGMPYVIRIKGPDPSGETVVNDLIHGPVTFANTEFDDFIIMKSDGTPTYNFACVLDDHAMKISHVLRAEEHLSNTPRQLILYQALGYTPPLFGHVPMVLAPDRAKLSKRHGAVAVEEFKAAGFLPEAILNYIALLGWSPGDDREIMTVDEMIEAFSVERISKTPAIYDVEKMTWVNGQHLRNADLDRVFDIALPALQAASYLPADPGPGELDYARAVVDTVRTRVRTVSEVIDAADYFFRDDFEYDPAGVKKRFDKPGVADLLERAAAVLQRVEPFDAEHTEVAYRQLCDELGIGTGALFHPTRLALTGRTMGPSLFDIIALLGRERCVTRLRRAAEFIRQREVKASS